jgi:L-threonylcarbamoyladenylate synthase
MNDLLAEAVKVLHLGGVVAHPTETCYGLAADVFSKAGVRKVYDLKGMDMGKPVSILVRDLEEAQRYGEFSPLAVKLALAYWPGPLTVIVPRKGGGDGAAATLPVWFNPGVEWIGFRVSSNKKTRELVEAFAGPLTTTSANKTGQAAPYSVQEILKQGLVPDFVLDGGQIGRTEASTVVKVIPGDGEEDDRLEILRQGPIQLQV